MRQIRKIFRLFKFHMIRQVLRVNPKFGIIIHFHMSEIIWKHSLCSSSKTFGFLSYNLKCKNKYFKANFYNFSEFIRERLARYYRTSKFILNFIRFSFKFIVNLVFPCLFHFSAYNLRDDRFVESIYYIFHYSQT